MNIAVTGGSGSVGSRIVEALLQQSHRVILLDRSKPADIPAKVNGAEFFWADLTRRETFGERFKGIDAVAHLGEAPNARAIPGADALFINNTTIGATVMQAAADAGVKKLVYASTSQVYGFWGTTHFPKDLLPTTWPMPEEQPARPLNAYALSKIANEGFARLLCENAPITIAAMRFPAAIDPASHWAPFIMNNLGTKPSEGFYVQIAMQSLVDAWCRALTQDLPNKFNLYHVASSDVAGVSPIRERLSKFYPDFPPLPADWPEFGAPVSTARAQRELGWQPMSLRAVLEGSLEGSLGTASPGMPRGMPTA
jgi:UDP-glucose 4-epimerase